MANFDQFADTYQQVHTQNIRVTGESSEYFARYKSHYFSRHMGLQFSGTILDYGCGVGMLSKYMKQTSPRPPWTDTTFRMPASPGWIP